MTVFKSSEEVFKYFREKYGNDADGDVNAIALFAYSLVEKERFEWKRHYRERHNADPSVQQIQEWFEDQPIEYFDRKEEEAYIWYSAFARSLLADEIEAACRQAVDKSMRDELRNLGHFWTDFVRGNLCGVTSNFIFALVLLGFVWIITSDFSISGWAKQHFGSSAPPAKVATP